MIAFFYVNTKNAKYSFCKIITKHTEIFNKSMLIKKLTLPL
jgi:hypothetical protein